MTTLHNRVDGRNVWFTGDIANAAVALAVTAGASASAEWRDGFHAALVAMLVALNCAEDIERIETVRTVTHDR